MNILILAAHPDDEVLGMGGTIKKFTKQKHNVKIILFATGIFLGDLQIIKILHSIRWIRKLIKK